MTASIRGHSAKVAITLVSQGNRVNVAQVGNSGILVRDLEKVVPPGEASLVVDIDGKKKRKKIILPQGISEPNTFMPFF